MKMPVIRGVIDRRILINYRADPDVVASHLPAPFRPQVVRGAAIAGICLIRLTKLRPAYLPSWLGIASENAAHRIAVEWDVNGSTRQGVYVRRRDTNSRLNAWAGGRLFPGAHHRARFVTDEANGRFDIAVRSQDGETRLSVRGRETDRLSSSVFDSVDEASDFFQGGSLGYSPTHDLARFQGVELRCFNWRIMPLEIEKVESSFFDDPRQFPAGSIEFDSAFLMRDIEHAWYCKPDFVTSQETDRPVALAEYAS